jgi:hypothetical protein
MAAKPIFSVNTLGKHAYHILQDEKGASVIGVTSRGIFLQSSSGHVIFLSLEHYRGPLTVNLPPSFQKQHFPASGDSIRLDFPRILLNSVTLLINDAAEIREPPIMIFPSGEMLDVKQRAASFCVELLRENRDSFFAPLLKIAADNSLQSGEKSDHIRSWLDANGPDKKEPKKDFLKRFIGFGSGLTPSGDDFICGYLLVEYYFGSSQHATEDILQAAISRTTALSASLIACAAEGMADERIMRTLKYFASGIPDAHKTKEELLSYGSSSGMDSLAGMLAAIYLNASN